MFPENPNESLPNVIFPATAARLSMLEPRSRPLRCEDAASKLASRRSLRPRLRPSDSNYFLADPVN